MAKLRHCAKFRCTGVQRRIVDGIFERGGERERNREGGGESLVKKGVRKASEQAIQPPEPDARGKRGRGRRKKEMAPVVAEAGGTVCYATGSGSSCRRHRKWPRNSLPCNSLLPFRCCSSATHLATIPLRPSNHQLWIIGRPFSPPSLSS